MSCSGEEIIDFVPPPRPSGLVLEGALVRLEPLSAAKHGDALFAAYADDQSAAGWRYLPYGPFASGAAFGEWLSMLEGGDDPVFFAIVTCVDNRPLGMASFLRISPEHGTIEVGHIHFSPALQKTPAATQAMYLMMNWAFEAGYRRYEWKCNALNMASRRAAQRLGLSYEGIFRQMLIVKNRNRDTAWFAAIDKEWPQLKRCFERFLSPDNFDDAGRARQSLSSLTRPHFYKTDTGL